MACPVSPADVAAELGNQVDPSDPRLVQATDAACTMVLADLGWEDYTDPVASPITRAITGLAVDLFRAPSTAFGYFVNDVGFASTGMDQLRRWRYLLDPYRTAWGLA